MRTIILAIVILALLCVLCSCSVHVSVNVDNNENPVHHNKPIDKLKNEIPGRSPIVGGSRCNNNPPPPNPGQPQYSCEKQKSWGKCSEPWMRGHCEITCGSCNNNVVSSGNCNNSPPKPSPGKPQHSCEDQKKWNKCHEPWMSGHCEITCGTCNSGGNGNSGNDHGVNSVKAAHISAPGSRNDYNLNSYGSDYKTKKNRILNALKSAGLSVPLQKLLLSIAMVETNSFDPKDRDTGKSGASENFSQFNMNRAFLEYVGFNGNLNELNSWDSLHQIVNVLKSGIKKLGVNGFLNFHRGGETGFRDPSKYGCDYYRNSVASMMRAMDRNPSLMTDDRRIDIYVKHA